MLLIRVTLQDWENGARSEVLFDDKLPCTTTGAVGTTADPEHLASRPAKVGDKLVTTKFSRSLTRGLCAIGEPNVAVCLQPGTELAFEREIEAPSGFWMRPRKLGAKLARFRRVNEACRTMHHDALELPGGQVVLLTSLCEAQHATVIQLPATERHQQPAQETRKSIVA